MSPVSDETAIRPVTQPHAGQVRGLVGSGRDLMRLSPGLTAYNIGYLALAWATAIAAVTLCWLHPAWYSFALAFLVVSSRQQALLNCEHEAVHRKFLPSRRANEFVGRFLCAGPVGSPFGAAQARHLSHHRLLGAPEDPDRDLYSGADKQSRRGLVGYFVNGLMGGYAGMVLMGPKAPRAASAGTSPRMDLLSLAAMQAVIFAGCALVLDWWVYPALWIAPLVTLTAFTHLVRSFVEHAVSDAEVPAHHNRLITIRSNLAERALLSPYSMNYHAEHHLLPSVPAPRLKTLQRRLQQREDVPAVLTRSSYSGAVRGYLRGLRHD